MKHFIFLLLFAVPLMSQPKKVVVARSDTLVSRTQLIATVKTQIDNITRNAQSDIDKLTGQLQVLQSMTQDSVWIRKQ